VNSRRRSRRAMTLIEILVALAVAVVVLIIVWGFYMTSNKLLHLSQRKLTAIQGALVLADRLASDIPQSLLDDDEEPRLADGRNGLMVEVFDALSEDTHLGDTTDQPSVGRKDVAYRLDGDTGQLTIKNGADEHPFLLARYRRLLFSYGVDDQRRTGGPTTDPRLQYLHYRLACVAGDEGGTASDPRTVVTLLGSVGLHQKASAAKFPFWNAPYAVHTD